MADEYEIFEFLESDFAETNKISKWLRMQLRKENGFLNINEEEFTTKYRLTKKLARNLCTELRPFIKSPQKSSDLPIETKVLIALYFYATGSYQRPTRNFSAEPTVSSIITEVTACLNTLQIRQKYLKFPLSHQECNKIKTEFYNKFGIPGVLGCIDCTHVAIVRPGSHEEHYYYHKQYHSLNVQLVCDSNMQIMSVDTSHGGATHDSFIWATHPLRSQLEDLNMKDSTWLLGDSEYPLRTTMMTPIQDATPNSPEAHYTHLHSVAWNTIQCTIKMLKTRFRCLLTHKMLHYSPEKAGSIFTACVILHNICIKANIPEPKLSNEDITGEAQSQESGNVKDLPHSNNNALQQGLATRSSLIQSLWEKRNLKSNEAEYQLHLM